MRPIAVTLAIATLLSTQLADARSANPIAVRRAPSVTRATRLTTLRLQRKQASLYRRIKPFAGETLSAIGGVALVTAGVLGDSEAAIGIGVAHLLQARLLLKLRRESGLTFNPATEMMQGASLAALIHPHLGELHVAAAMTLAISTGWKAYDAGVHFTRQKLLATFTQSAE